MSAQDADPVAPDVAVRRADIVDASALARLFEEMRAENGRPGSDDDFAGDLARWMETDCVRHLTWVAELAGSPVLI